MRSAFLRIAFKRITCVRGTLRKNKSHRTPAIQLAALILAAMLAPYTPVFAEIAHNNISQTGTSQIYVPPQPAMRSAGMIFSGTVLKIEHLKPAGSPGITQITFRVENAIRGTHLGENLTIREWEGLWNSGERYRPGERVLLFLYPQSKLGLTSPVGGAVGRYEVDRTGQVLINNIGNTGPRPKPIHIHEFAAAIRRAAREQ